MEMETDRVRTIRLIQGCMKTALTLIAVLGALTLCTLLLTPARAQEPPDFGQAPWVNDCLKMGILTKQIALARDDGRPQCEVVDELYANRDDYPAAFKMSGRSRATIAKAVREVYTSKWTVTELAQGMAAQCLKDHNPKADR